MGEPVAPEPASHRTLAVATAVSLVVAGIGLVLVILPASYGIDPTGLGGAMGFAPERAPVADTDATEITLLVGANRSFAYRFRLADNESAHIAWNSTGPLEASLRGVDAKGALRPVDAAWAGNDTWQTTTFTAPFTGRFEIVWTNTGAEPVTVGLRIATAH